MYFNFWRDFPLHAVATRGRTCRKSDWIENLLLNAREKQKSWSKQRGFTTDRRRLYCRTLDAWSLRVDLWQCKHLHQRAWGRTTIMSYGPCTVAHHVEGGEIMRKTTRIETCRLGHADSTLMSRSPTCNCDHTLKCETRVSAR